MKLSFGNPATLLFSVFFLGLGGCNVKAELNKLSEKNRVEEQEKTGKAPTTSVFAVQLLSLKSIRLLGDIGSYPTDWRSSEILQKAETICLKAGAKDGSKVLWISVWSPEANDWKKLKVTVDYRNLAWELEKNAYVGTGDFVWNAEVQLEGARLTDSIRLLEEDLNEGQNDGKPATRTIGRYFENNNDGYGLGVELRLRRAADSNDKILTELCPESKL